MDLCPICSKSAGIRSNQDDTYIVSCQICGDYSITWEAKSDFLSGRSTFINYFAKISAYLRQRKIRGLPVVTIYRDKEIADNKSLAVSIDEIVMEFPKTVTSRIDQTIYNLSKLSI